MAHIPVPVPTSRISWADLEANAKKSLKGPMYLRRMQRSQVQLAIKCQEIHMVSNILLLVCNIVIRPLQKSERANRQVLARHPTYPVSTVAKGMISSPIFIAVFGHIRREGLGIISEEGVLAVGRVVVFVRVVIQLQIRGWSRRDYASRGIVFAVGSSSRRCDIAVLNAQGHVHSRGPGSEGEASPSCGC